MGGLGVAFGSMVRVGCGVLVNSGRSVNVGTGEGVSGVAEGGIDVRVGRSVLTGPCTSAVAVNSTGLTYPWEQESMAAKMLAAPAMSLSLLMLDLVVCNSSVPGINDLTVPIERTAVFIAVSGGNPAAQHEREIGIR